MTHKITQIRSKLTVIAVLTFILVMASCNSVKEFKYFADIQKDSVTNITVKPKESILQPGDLLQIIVTDQDEVALRQINGASQAAAGGGASGGGTSGYLVNDSGLIKFPLIGAIKAKGLYKDQLADTIRVHLINMKLLLDPIVNVRLVNFKVTVLGEVMKPGVIMVPNEKITVTEAISQSGDITIFGKRDNVLVIREKNGKRYYKRLDLTKNSVFDSEFYYLENQDIVYVEPTKRKAASLSKTTQVYSTVISTVSVLLLIYTQLLK